MGDGLDVVALRVEDERAVVVRVVLRADAGAAVVVAAGRERRRMECVHRRAVRRGEGDVQRRRRGPVGDPEVRLAVLAEADAPLAVHDHRVAERGERGDVEGAGGGEVRDPDVQVVDHAATLPPRGDPLLDERELVHHRGGSTNG